MAGGFSRRSLLVSALAVRLRAQERGAPAFPSEITPYLDDTTELDVYRLTDPAHTSTLPAGYNRAIARDSAWMLFCCNRQGTPQVFRMDLRTGETRPLTSVEGLDGTSVTLTPDNRLFCFFAGRSLYAAAVAGRPRQLYEVPEGWDRCPGMSVGPDGTHATFAEQRGGASRLRMVSLGQGVARTVTEAAFVMSHPVARPLRAQVMFRQENALWLVNSDGSGKRPLKLAPGGASQADWGSDKTLLYLNSPEEARQAITIREHSPDDGADRLVAKTSQYAALGFNRDTSVFVAASRSAASPVILIMLRRTQEERVLCEHKASQPEMTAPRFSPDAQRIYFQSDREGRSAIYCFHVEKLVDKIAG
jgi:oligogalacturonide lyase